MSERSETLCYQKALKWCEKRCDEEQDCRKEVNNRKDWFEKQSSENTENVSDGKCEKSTSKNHWIGLKQCFALVKKIKRSTRAGGVWWSVGSDSAALSKSWKRFRSHSVFTMTFRSHCWVLESKFENFHKLALAVIDQIWKSVLAKAVVGKKLI